VEEITGLVGKIIQLSQRGSSLTRKTFVSLAHTRTSAIACSNSGSFTILDLFGFLSYFFFAEG